MIPTVHLHSSPNSKVSPDIAIRAIKAIAEDCTYATSQSYSEALQGCFPILCSSQFVPSCNHDGSLRAGGALRSTLVPILQWAIDVCLVAENDSINRRCIQKTWQQFEYLIYRLPWGRAKFTASFRAKLAMQHRISPCVLRALLQVLCWSPQSPSDVCQALKGLWAPMGNCWLVVFSAWSEISWVSQC